MGKLTFLVGFAALVACGAGDDSAAESDASHDNWTVFAGSHAAEYVAGTGVSEAGRAAPEPVVDAGTPDAGQPVEVDAGHAAGSGGSAGHVVAEVAGSGEAGHAGAAGREAVAGSGGSAGSAPAPVETVLCTASASGKYAHYSLNIEVDADFHVYATTPQETLSLSTVAFKSDTALSADQLNPESAANDAMLRKFSSVEIVWSAIEPGSGAKPSTGSVRAACALEPHDKVTGYRLSGTLDKTAAVAFTAEVRGFKAQ